MNYCSGWFKNLRIKNKQILMIALAKVVPASLGRIRHPLRHFLPQNKGTRGQGRGRKGREWRKENRRRKRGYIHTFTQTHTHKKSDVQTEEEKSEALVVRRAPQSPHRRLCSGPVPKQSLSRYENVGIARQEERKGDALHLLNSIREESDPK